MFNPDWINGAMEFLSAVFMLPNVLRILKDKQVRGVSLLSTFFFDAWGFWNLYYYPSLDQWWSFVGGAFLLCVNLIWAGLAIYYVRKEHDAKVKGRGTEATLIRGAGFGGSGEGIQEV